MSLRIYPAAYLYGCRTPVVRGRAQSGKMLFESGQPSFSFLKGDEFYHAEPDPFTVAVAHFPESAGEECFSDGVAEYEAIDKRWGVHGRYEGNAL